MQEMPRRKTRSKKLAQEQQGILQKLSRRQQGILFIIVFGVINLLLILLLIWFNHQNTRIAESQEWPSTTGIIVSTAVKTGSREVGSGYSETTVTYYEPALKYSYYAGGREYTSENISVNDFGGLDTYSTQEEAVSFLEQHYPIGKKVVVYYNPENQQDAFLLKSQPIPMFPGIGAQLSAVIVFSLGCMIYIFLNLDKPFAGREYPR